MRYKIRIIYRMLKKLRKRIEDKRHSKNLFWKILVFGKDIIRDLQNHRIRHLYSKKQIKLDPDKVKAYMKDKDNLIITFGNQAIMPLILNWIEDLKRLNIYNYLIFATDKKLYKELTKQNINVHYLKAGLSENYQKIGSYGWNKLLYFRELLIYELLKLNINILLSDADVTWLKNPADYMDKGHDMQVQWDDPALFQLKETPASFRCNGGLFYIKSSKKTIELFKKILDEMHKFPYLNDQVCFNRVLEKNKEFIKISIPSSETEKDKNKLNLNILDPLLFPNGALYFKQHEKFKRYKTEPVVVHANWIVGLDTKIELLKKHNFWNL